MRYLRWLSKNLEQFQVKMFLSLEWAKNFILRPLISALYIPMIFTVALLAVACIALHSQQQHDTYLRKWVGSSVYLALPQGPNHGGGTAFSVKGKSGTVYFLTNDHICMRSKDNTVLLKDDGGFAVVGRIVERSQITDLCLISSPQMLVPLDLANNVSIGQKVQTVGHPNLYALTIGNTGEVVQTYSTSLRIGAIDNTPEAKVEQLECDLTNKKFFVYKTKEEIQCRLPVPEAYVTTSLVRPGSSGSPLVNFEGDVVGVVCGMDAYGWGIVVSLPAVKEFLSNH